MSLIVCPNEPCKELDARYDGMVLVSGEGLLYTMEPQEMQMRLDALFVAYANVLEFTRCLAIDTVHHEVARLYE